MHTDRYTDGWINKTVMQSAPLYIYGQILIWTIREHSLNVSGSRAVYMRTANWFNLLFYYFTYKTCSCSKWPRPIGDNLDIPLFLRILSKKKHQKELSMERAWEGGDPKQNKAHTEVVILQLFFLHFTK